MRCVLTFVLGVLIWATWGCGGGGGGTPPPASGPTTLDLAQRVAVYISPTLVGNGEARVGDRLGNDIWTGFIWFDLSSLPATATITNAELIVPVTGEENDPRDLLPALVSHEGYVASITLSITQTLITLEHNNFDGVFGPLPQAGRPPAWNVDVTGQIQSDVTLGKPHALFRIRPSAASNGDGVADVFTLCGVWNATQLQYLATLRITYTN